MAKKLKRRDFLKYSTYGALGITGTTALVKIGLSNPQDSNHVKDHGENISHNSHHPSQLGAVGDKFAAPVTIPKNRSKPL